MDLTSDRFPFEIVKILREIADSHFVAFDLEFSGVAGRGPRRLTGKPTLQELYSDTKSAAEKYQVLQVGLTIVKEDIENTRYIVKPYNFNISPLPTLRERHFRRDWCMNSGAVQFLLKNRFNFGLPLTTGIPYLSRLEEQGARIALNEEDNVKLPDMVLKTEDEALVKHIRKSIAKWQDQPSASRDGFINIPNEDRGKAVPGALNRYQMRLTHQVVQNDFPTFRTVGMQSFVQITSPKPEELERQKRQQQSRVDYEIGRAIGFRWILEALAGNDISGLPDECLLAALPSTNGINEVSTVKHLVESLNEDLKRRPRILVGHNCFTDLINLHKFFIGELPEKVEDFQDSVHDLFPAVIDTKYMASFGNGRWGDTSLSAVSEEADYENEVTIHIPPEFDRYSDHDREHEAGFDSLMTANIAIKLSAKMDKKGAFLHEQRPETSTSQYANSVVPFGTKDDGYVTASEDAESEARRPNKKTTPSERPIMPVVAVENTFNTGSLKDAGQKPSSLTESPQPVNKESSLGQANGIIAVREKKRKPGTWNSVAEVDKVKSAFAAANIYDVLEEARAEDSGQVNKNKTDSWDDGLELLRNESKNAPTIESLAQRGQLMPRWDDVDEFWQRFGNRLQVNSCKEGVCKLW